eukprot:scaffold1243_cov173-Ochromonas_danica.AAC.17
MDAFDLITSIQVYSFHDLPRPYLTICSFDLDPLPEWGIPACCGGRPDIAEIPFFDSLPAEAMGYMSLAEINFMANELNNVIRRSYVPPCPSMIWLICALPLLFYCNLSHIFALADLVKSWKRRFHPRKLSIHWTRYYSGFGMRTQERYSFHIVRAEDAPLLQLRPSSVAIASLQQETDSMLHSTNTDEKEAMLRKGSND